MSEKRDLMAMYMQISPEYPFCITKSNDLYVNLRVAFAHDTSVFFMSKDYDSYAFIIRFLGIDSYELSISVPPLSNRAMFQTVYSIGYCTRFPDSTESIMYEDPVEVLTVDAVIDEIKRMGEPDSDSESDFSPIPTPPPSPSDYDLL